MLLELDAFNRSLKIPVGFSHKVFKIMFVFLQIYLPHPDKTSPNKCYHAVLQSANILPASFKKHKYYL